MTSWSVQYTPPNGVPQVVGGTGMPSEAFALGVFEKMREKVLREGGIVELMKNGEMVAKCEVPEGKP